MQREKRNVSCVCVHIVCSSSVDERMISLAANTLSLVAFAKFERSRTPTEHEWQQIEAERRTAATTIYNHTYNSLSTPTVRAQRWAFERRSLYQRMRSSAT